MSCFVDLCGPKDKYMVCGSEFSEHQRRMISIPTENKKSQNTLISNRIRLTKQM